MSGHVTTHLAKIMEIGNVWAQARTGAAEPGKYPTTHKHNTAM